MAPCISVLGNRRSRSLNRNRSRFRVTTPCPGPDKSRSLAWPDRPEEHPRGEKASSGGFGFRIVGKQRGASEARLVRVSFWQRGAIRRASRPGGKPPKGPGQSVEPLLSRDDLESVRPLRAGANESGRRPGGARRLDPRSPGKRRVSLAAGP